MHPRRTGLTAGLLAAGLVAAVLAPSAGAQSEADLGRYFGFDAVRILPIDEDCGPTISGDFNNDGLPDVCVVNNRKSRIEVHFLRAQERTEAERARHLKPNEIAPSPWYDREYVSVPHRVQALRAPDVDGDGRLDLVYAGANPSEIVVLRQTAPGRYEEAFTREVKGLSARQAGMEIADVLGDTGPELIALTGNQVSVFPLGPGGVLGEPTRLGSTALAAVFIEDFDGDGLADLLGAAPDDATPLRLWLQRQDPRSREKNGMLPAETRFESPAIREAEPVRFPGRAAASIGVIEKASRRMVFYDVVSTPAPQTSPEAAPVREVRAEVAAFTGGASADRSVAMVDLDLDGLEDLLATDAASNTVVWHRQAPGAGLGRGEPFSALKKPKSVAAGQWDGQGPPEVFILSEEEKAVGVSAFDAAAGRLAFPTPLPVKTAGATPVAMDFVGVGAGGMLAVIVRDRRDHTLELHAPASGGVRGPEAITAVKLEGVSRPPQAMLAADADQDGATDLLLFTPNEPMVMVRGAAEGGAGGPPTQVLTDKTMPQFGLVQAAGPDNTALLDIDANGKPELLIADENFVRAARYSPETGWSVVEQITMPEPGTQFVGVAVLPGPEGEVIVASDKGHGRLVLIGRAGEGSPRAWTVTQQLRLKGFDLGPVFAGRFGGGQEPTVLAIGADGFALVRLDGAAARLEQFAAYRSESEDRNEHEMEPGDLNGDGFVDIAVLDSGDRMCQLLTFSAARKLHLATEFEVFQTKRFARGRGGDGEPRDAMVADLTGDGRHDLLITVHDRLNIYRQAVAPGPRAEVAR